MEALCARKSFHRLHKLGSGYLPGVGKLHIHYQSQFERPTATGDLQGASISAAHRPPREPRDEDLQPTRSRRKPDAGGSQLSAPTEGEREIGREARAGGDSFNTCMPICRWRIATDVEWMSQSQQWERYKKICRIYSGQPGG